MFIDLTVGNLIEPVSGRHWDRREIGRQVARRIARLQQRGVIRGDRVLIPFGNCLEFFAELLAIWRVGACAVPIDGRLTAFEITNLAYAARPKLAVVDDSTDATVCSALKDAGVVCVVTSAVEEPEAQACQSQLDDDALILFTSGSTGEPKGVVHTHRSLRARWMALREHLGTHAFRRSLCLLPTHFGHGLICNALFPWLSGQDLFIAPPYRPELLTKLGALIDEHAITFMSSVPSIWRLALKLARPPRAGTLERVHCGSAPLSGVVWENIRNWTGTKRVCNAYGITETGSWVAGLAEPDGHGEDGLIGEGWGAVIKVLRSAESQLPLDPDLECAVGEAGYVWLNTPALMKGYYLREDLTQKAVVDGWFLTGDIGAIDEQGRLILRGRERDEINKGGIKIYPGDIDSVVDRFDRATDACAFAVDDHVYGQTVGLAVVLANADQETIRDLYGWLQQHLAAHKLPGHWWVVDAIPRTSRGKVNRDAVKAACMAQAPLDLVNLMGGRAS